MEKILCAAIHVDDDKEYIDAPIGIQFGFIVCGRRHSDCYQTIELLTGNTELGNTVGRERQGFVTSYNRYVGRKEAWTIAIKANQVVHGPTNTDEDSILISENLY
jgi:hypothetical protein